MLNNCVGKDNRVFVITYLTSTSILLTSIIISAILSLVGTQCVDANNCTPKGVPGFKAFSTVVSGIGCLTSLILLATLYFLILFCKEHIK